MDISWSPDSTTWERLKPTGTNRVRTAWGNVVGCYGQYLRYWSNEQWAPPYTWTGRVRPIKTMIPPIFDSPRPDNLGNITDVCWYTPALNFYTMRVDGAHHTLLQVGSQADPTKVGTTAKLDNKYGVRTGYVSRTFTRLPKSPWDGLWHDFRIEVLSHSHYQLWWDGVLVADVVEKEPATMEGATRVGFRLDFCDVEFDSMKVVVPDMSPFDHSRYEWYPPGLCSPAKVCKSDGTPRAALKLPLKEFVVHYGGAGTNWTDFGDTAKELASVELYARGEKKPNEYNSVSDSASETWEYSGRFQSAGNGVYNPTTWSHLTLYGLEKLTEVEAQGLIKGIRRARQQCVDAGYLTADHIVNPHNFYKGTSCPGPLWTNKRWWDQIAAPLGAPQPPTPTPPIPTPPQGDDTVLIGYVKHPNHAAVYRQFSNGTKTWITDGDELAVYNYLNSGPVKINTMPNNSWMKATGVIVGPVPAGVDAYGVPVK